MNPLIILSFLSHVGVPDKRGMRTPYKEVDDNTICVYHQPSSEVLSLRDSAAQLVLPA